MDTPRPSPRTNRTRPPGGGGGESWIAAPGARRLVEGGAGLRPLTRAGGREGRCISRAARTLQRRDPTTARCERRQGRARARGAGRGPRPAGRGPRGWARCGSGARWRERACDWRERRGRGGERERSEAGPSENECQKEGRRRGLTPLTQSSGGGAFTRLFPQRSRTHARRPSSPLRENKDHLSRPHRVSNRQQPSVESPMAV